MKNDFKKRNIFIILFLGLLFSSLVLAEPITDDLHLNIQTTNSTGSVVTGTFDFAFNISNNSDCAAANVVYSNSTTLTTDSRGIISYYLENINLSFSEQYWLCYYRNGTLINNSKIARTPYAFTTKNISAEGILNDSNLDLTGKNITASSGLFTWLGSLLKEITKIFVVDINASGNITANYFFGNINASYVQNNPWLEDSQEGNLNVNSSNYLDGYNSSFFMPLNTSVVGNFTITGKLDIDGDWQSGGVTIDGGDIFAQTGYFYNITSLNVTKQNLTIIDNLTIGGHLFSSGTGDNYFMGSLGIGTGNPSQKLEVNGYILADNFNATSSNTSIGVNAGSSNTGKDITAIGYHAGGSNTGIQVTATGYYAGYLNTGDYFTGFGAYSGSENPGNYLTATGYRAGSDNIGNHLTATGYYAGYSNDGNYSTTTGSYAGYLNTGESLTATGYQAGASNSGDSVTVTGHFAGNSNTGNWITSIGYYASSENEGNYSTALGYYAGGSNTGESLTATGSHAGYSNSGDYLTAIGSTAGNSNSGDYLTAIGHYSGYSNDGNYSIGIGYEALKSNSGNNVVAIGDQAGEGNTLSDQFIVKQTRVNAVPLIQGNFSSGNVGIGTESPDHQLHVYKTGGNAEFEIESATDNAYMYLNAPADEYNGIIWQVADSIRWTLNKPANSDDLRLYSESAGVGEVIRFDYDTGNVGIGTISPGEKLEVVGDVNISGSGGTIGRANLANGWLKLGTGLAMDNNELYFGSLAYIGTLGTNDLSIDTNGTTRILIDGTTGDSDFQNNAIKNIDWSTSDDGSDSGLDADKLDNIDSLSFLRSDADDTMSQSLTFSDTNGILWESGVNRITHNDGGGNVQIRFGNDYSDTDERFTHAGTAFYIGGDLDSSAGTLQFKVASNGGAGDNQPVVWGDLLSISPSTLKFAGNVNITGNLTVGGLGQGVPAGAIMAFNSATCPVGWIPADGDNGTPDLRGLFVRGAGISTSYTMANGTAFSAAFDTYQSDSFQEHKHEMRRPPWTTAERATGNTFWSPDVLYAAVDPAVGVNEATTAGTAYGTPRTSGETRPASYALTYCQKTTEDSGDSTTIWGVSGNDVVLNNQSQSLSLADTPTTYYAPNVSEESWGTFHTHKEHLLNNADPTGPATYTITCSNVSDGAKGAWIYFYHDTASQGDLATVYLREYGTTTEWARTPPNVGVGTSYTTSMVGKVPLDSSKRFDVYAGHGGVEKLHVYMRGYYI